VANYNVDIEVALNGAKKIKSFEDNINRLNQELDELNNKQKQINKGNPFNAAGVRKYSAATKDAAKSVGTLVRRNKEAIKSTDALIKKSEEAVRKRENFRQLFRDADEIRGTIGSSRRAGVTKRAGAAVSAGAFPLLFGGGPAMSIGGAIGGAVSGSTFGPLSIGLQVFGGKLDEFAQNMRSLSDQFADTSDVLGVLEGAGVQVDSSLNAVVNTLKEQGRFAEAYNLELRELEKRFGPGAQNMLADYNVANERLGDEFSRLTTELQSYAIPALTLFTNIIARIASVIPDIPGIVGFGVGTVLGPGAGFATKQAMRAGEQAGSVRTNMFGFAGATNSDRERLAKQREHQLEKERDKEAKIEKINSNQLKIAKERKKETADKLKLLRAELDLSAQRVTIGLSVAEATREQEFNQAQARVRGEQSLRALTKQQTLGYLNLIEQGQTTASEDQLSMLFGQLKAVKFKEIEQQAETLGGALNEAGFDLQFITEEVKRYINVLQTLAKTEFTERLANFKTIDDVFDDQIQKLEFQIKAEEALTKEARQRAELELLILGVREQNTQLKPAQLELLEQKTTKLFNLRNKENSPIKLFLEDSIDALKDVETRAVQVAQGIGDAIGSSLVNGAQNLITGAATVKEVFADMLNSVANVLAQSAAQMIATYISIGIAKAFAFGQSPSPAGSQGNPFGSDVVVPGLGGSAVGGGRIPLNSYAEGGYVNKPTNALIGEGGEPEYVIPESKMRESMARYSRGSRGGGVIPSSSGGGAESSGGVAVAAPIDVRYTVERINSVDYVTADQFQRGMQQAATQGAREGEQQTLKRLQMSSSTRRRLGM